MMGNTVIFLFLYTATLNAIQNCDATSIAAPTKVNNNNTVDGPLRISSYMVHVNLKVLFKKFLNQTFFSLNKKGSIGWRFISNAPRCRTV